MLPFITYTYDPVCVSHGEGSDSEFSSHFYPPPIWHFSQIQYNCYPIGCTGHHPLSIMGTRACHHHPHPGCVWRRPWHWVFLLYFCHYFKCFVTSCFSVKLLFSRWGVLLFFIFIPPPHFNLPCPMFQLKFACQNLHFVVLISYINQITHLLKIATPVIFWLVQ